MPKHSYYHTEKEHLERILLVVAFLAGGAGVMGHAAPPPAALPKPNSRNSAKSPKNAVEKQATSRPAFRPIEGGLRDPFLVPKPPVAVPPGQQVVGEVLDLSPVQPGLRGLIISQVKLEGIVVQGKNNPKMIAVLANAANRAYFAHENDSLRDGVITKITTDSVYFRENFRDPAGSMSSHEVVKKLAPAPGEKK